MFLATTFTPDRAGLVESSEPPLESTVAPLTVNELVLEVRRRNLQRQIRSLRPQSLPTVRQVVGDIGTVTAQLSGPSN